MNKFKVIFASLGIVVLASFSLVSIPNSAHACSCLPVGTAEESLETSSAVFSGQVMSIHEDESMAAKKVTFSVDTVWKGILGETIEVTTGMDSAGCGFEFTIGENYMVYASGEEALSTTLCSRTHQAILNDPDVQTLGEGMPPVQIEFTDPDQQKSAHPYAPVIAIGAVIVLGILYKVFMPQKAA